MLSQVKNCYVACNWVEAYDFIEFVANVADKARFIADCNVVLEKHLSAYRFVGTTLTPITSEEEISAVEQALSHGERFGPGMAHIETALARLADRSSPDYRNSI